MKNSPAENAVNKNNSISTIENLSFIVAINLKNIKNISMVWIFARLPNISGVPGRIVKLRAINNLIESFSLIQEYDDLVIKENV